MFYCACSLQPHWEALFHIVQLFSFLWVLVFSMNISFPGWTPLAVASLSDFALASGKELQITIECGFTLKRVCDMTRTYSEMHRTYKYSENCSIVWSVWQNDWVFVYELSGSRFETSCSHLTLRFHVCFEQGAPSHSGNYRVWIHSEMHTWHEKNIQSNLPYR